MKRERLVLVACIVACLRMASAQDFKRSYSIPPNGQIFIETLSGNIKMQGYKGDKVEVVAYKKGPEENEFEIEDRSSGDVINLRARPRMPQPDSGKIPPGKSPPGGFDASRFPQAKFPPGGFNPGRFDVGDNSVNFEIRVPKSGDYSSSLHSMSGTLEISGISGRITARVMRGSLNVKDIRGTIRCNAFNGGIQVELGSQKDETNDMRFSSMNGDVVVKAPGDLDAEIFMSSETGRLKIDYPIKVQEMRYGHRLSAEGKLGSGRQKLTITSVSGNVSLLKK